MKSTVEYVSPEKALSFIESNNRVFIQGSAHTPSFLLKHLAQEAHRLQNVEVVSITVYGDIHINKPELIDHFHVNSLFVSASVRQSVKEGYADYVPVFLSEIPELFKQKILPIDVAIVHVSVPDEHGYCSLGISVDIARSAVDSTKYIIAQVNPNAPRTHGDGMIHSSRFAAMVWCEDPLHEANFAANAGPETLKVGEYVASLIDDRCTLQMGIGAIPDAVLGCLHNHKDLGVHTEMCSDGIIHLVEKDVINNRYKKIHPNKTVSSFALGSRKLYDYVNDNPSFAFLDIDYVNDPHVIKRNNKMIAINSAVEIDITGQACADSIGTYQYSGVGGQMDFMRGAALSEGGKPIIALPSRTAKGISRIVPTLKNGAGVVTTRAHMHYVVTEYGIACLFGKNLRQRAKALINIAHPEDREMLEKSCFERFKIF
ncbi:acetyl-CoA hydrolase/transferase family protein [Panacibacter ginsenosidivorans]|uniref:Acetyl-CoA hydrolase/transferase family protein n=1 Tax=Panacibacter ginsenosidivorans TaxID=1813871 RepID=A0A5B8V5V8_9BACT|nr:acetyl-CoA hydrolase/transferase C-terminal domain-containing protein [Panacibacter ginsenosidivorans]QEC66465.1 acetyl-CoA hydrolase/transferase family protein [Panacibacter ginsenosidivorans]